MELEFDSIFVFCLFCSKKYYVGSVSFIKLKTMHKEYGRKSILVFTAAILILSSSVKPCLSSGKFTCISRIGLHKLGNRQKEYDENDGASVQVFDSMNANSILYETVF